MHGSHARNFAFVLALALASGPLAAGRAEAAASPASQAATVQSVARSSMQQYHIKALIVRVTSGGRNVYTGAYGESMAGVPATSDMHFRNGAMAFTYLATLLLEMVDQKKVRLDEKLSKFFPNLPSADKITLKNLANMTSGYADYVYQPEMLTSSSLHPFRQWTSQQLMQLGISKPMQFVPGTNWGYSHTNYVILGFVLAKVTGMPLNRALQRYVLGPMGLTQTQGFDTPQIPEPALHSFSSERRGDLAVPPATPFYEESTYWNPSWTTANGAVETSTITDMTSSMAAVGTGKLLSKASFAAQVKPNLAGFGHTDAACSACRGNTLAFNYGLGVVNLGPWITQTKSFSGSDATVGYLPARNLSIAIEATYLSSAFDAKGNSKGASQSIFRNLADAFAPNTLPKMKP